MSLLFNHFQQFPEIIYSSDSLIRTLWAVAVLADLLCVDGMENEKACLLSVEQIDEVYVCTQSCM
jgi:hypothetical protein